MKKNIVFFNFSDAGFFSHRSKYAKKLINDGFNVFLIAPIKTHKKKLNDMGIKTINLQIKKRYDFNPLKILKIIFFLNKTLKRLSPKVLNNVGIFPVILGTVSSFNLNYKIINSITGLGSVAISKSFKNSLLTFILKFIFFLFIRNTNIIVQNKTDKFFSEKLGLNKKKIFLIPGYGIDIDIYKKSKQINKTPKVILHSRLLRVKGIYDYFIAARYLKKKNIKANFYLFGDFDDNNPDSININEIKKLNIKNYFSYMGQDNKIQFSLNKFDIACLPSYREGLPRSLLECMASKMPIVTTNVPGNKDVVKNNFNGFLIKEKSPKLLAKALSKLILNRNLRVKMGKNSLKKCKLYFSTTVIFKKLDKIFLNEKY